MINNAQRDELDDLRRERGGLPGGFYHFRPGELLIVDLDHHLEQVSQLLGVERDRPHDAADVPGDVIACRPDQRKVKRFGPPTSPYDVSLYRYSKDINVPDALASLRDERITCDYNYVSARTPMRSHPVSAAEPIDQRWIDPPLPAGKPDNDALRIGVLDTGRPVYGEAFRTYYKQRFHREGPAGPIARGPIDDELAAGDNMFVRPARRDNQGKRGAEAEEEPTGHADADTMVAPFGRLTHPHAGHGIFVSSIIARHAPGVAIVAEATMYDDGVADLYELINDLHHAVEDGHCKLVNISMGFRAPIVPGEDPAEGEHSPVLDHVIGQLREDVLVVASAGNDANDRRTWPAAHKAVVGVAATDKDGRPTDWSNYGDWVDACAVGENVVSSYPFADWDFPDGTAKRFHGAATWSGTSFSAPLVTALIAQRMLRAPHLSAPDAWAELRDAAGPPLDDFDNPMTDYGVLLR